MAQSIKEFKAAKKEAIALAEAVTALRKNKAFKKVIAKGFFEDEPVRCARVKALYSMRDPLSQDMINRRITGVGELQVYLQTIEALGNLAINELAEAEELAELPEGEEYEVEEDEE